MKQILEWLGREIAQPLHYVSCEDQAAALIAPSPTLKPHERVHIYRQQYWWRLLSVMGENFPSLLRLFDLETFHQKLVIPYLSAHPPTHWSLNKLGETFPGWLKAQFLKDLAVFQLAEIDCAVNRAFWVKRFDPVNFTGLSTDQILTQEMTLQPHVQLFEYEGDFFTLREELLKLPAQKTSDLPEIIYEKCYFVLYRTPQNVVSWKKISQAEMVALSLFQAANTIDHVCAALEKQGGELLEEALSKIPIWFKQWTVLSWLRSSLS